MTIQDFIIKRPHLIWYTKNYKGLSPEAVVEATLNYGDWDDVQKLIAILGMKKTAKIFYKQAQQKRCNYHEKSTHYFSLYFKRRAHA
ncbi:MAG: hypothetical protein HY974_00830 [Candidatus Kerfeldbacteria bacterium]|nr:hypothetical protein [Candidatus Kerfeldbacteria bacterium]